MAMTKARVSVLEARQEEIRAKSNNPFGE